MKNILTLILFVILVQNVNAQKMYIWCPDKLVASPKPDQLNGVSVNVFIEDSRILTEKTKNKCSTEELKNSFFLIIKETYPSANINLVTDNNKKKEGATFLIEVNITAYYAIFTSGMWYAQTDLSVKISDLKNETSNPLTKDIQKEKKFFNVGGFATAKNNLNKSYIEANIELLSFISDSINK